MAKSLRSKRRRKMRAEKRVTNAKKELVKLREVAAKLHGNKFDADQIPDVKLVDAPAMDVDSDSGSDGESPRVKPKAATKINNQWMNQRKIKAIKSKIRRHNKKKTRRGGSAGLSSRKAKKSVKR